MMNYKKKKIILSSNSSWNLYNFRINLIKKFLYEDYEVYVVAKEDKYSSKLKNIGCYFIPLFIEDRSFSITNNLYLIYQYFKIFYRIKPQYYFGFTIKPNIIANFSAIFFNIKIINTVTGLGSSFTNYKIFKFFILFLYFISFIKSYKIFFQNNFDYIFFTKYFISKKNKSSIVNGSGINLKSFGNNKFKYPNKNLKFLYIGRMLKEKGLFELLEVCNIIKKKYPDIQFKFVGSFEKNSVNLLIKEKILNLSRQKTIEYNEFTDDISLFIEEADCIILPSYREGMPKALLESASFSKPLIATDVPGCNEIVFDNYNGFLCKPKNINSLKVSIEKFINLDINKKKLFGINSYNLVREKFDEKIVISKYLNVIK